MLKYLKLVVATLFAAWAAFILVGMAIIALLAAVALFADGRIFWGILAAIMFVVIGGFCVSTIKNAVTEMRRRDKLSQQNGDRRYGK